MILDEILEKKRLTVEKNKLRLSYPELEEKLRHIPPPRNFISSIYKPGSVRIIAELKSRSPSAGIICKDFNVPSLASTYERSGVAAISVLTEEHFFHGDIFHLLQIKEATNLPVLRKDFIFDPYQVLESRAFGADAILLIVSMLSDDLLVKLQKKAETLGMASIVEVHNEKELLRAVDADAKAIGVNNRNLENFTVDKKTVFNLLTRIPDDKVVIAESGLNNVNDIERLKDTGRVHAALVGEAFLRHPNLQEITKNFVKAGE